VLIILSPSFAFLLTVAVTVSSAEALFAREGITHVPFSVPAVTFLSLLSTLSMKRLSAPGSLTVTAEAVDEPEKAAIMDIHSCICMYFVFI
jgi:hypothetical protein